jgi:hypothetical protein
MADLHQTSGGIHIIEGPPGSGKSWFMVRRAILTVASRRMRRPVYTNLPIRMRVARRYIQGIVQKESGAADGAVVAQLLQPLTKEHFCRFLDRVVALDQFRDAYKAECNRDGRKFSYTTCERLFLKVHGEHINQGYIGDDGEEVPGNWIPAHAKLMLDELHEWFPMTKQSQEIPQLLGYVAMHRHMGHQIDLISQDRMQVSITFRRMCETYTKVFNKKDLKLAWGLRYKHLFGWLPAIGVAFGYEVWTKIGEESQYGDNAGPIESFSAYPLMPGNRWVFRVYDSYTRAGSSRQLKAQMAKERVRVNLRPDGLTAGEGVKRDAKVAKMNRRDRSVIFGLVRGVMRWTFRLGYTAAIVAGTALVTLKIADDRDRLLSEHFDTEGAAVAASVEAEELEWPRIGGLSSRGISYDGQLMKKGERRDGVRLVDVSVPHRGAVFIRDGDYFVWKYRQGDPRRVGPVSEVLPAIKERYGVSDPNAGSDDASGGSLGIKAGDGVPGDRSIQ